MQTKSFILSLLAQNRHRPVRHSCYNSFDLEPLCGPLRREGLLWLLARCSLDGPQGGLPFVTHCLPGGTAENPPDARGKRLAGGTGSPNHHESLKASISGLCRTQGKATSVGRIACPCRPLMAPSDSIKRVESVHAGGVGFLPHHHHPIVCELGKKK